MKQDMPTELDTDAAVKFLLEKIDPSGWHNIVAIPPDSGPIGRTFAPGQSTAMFDFIDAHNGHANLYFSVNEPRPNAPHDKLSAADIANARAVHVDLDPPAGADLAADRIESIRRISSAPVQPTFLTDSGGGIQAFWKLAEKVPLDTSDWLRNLNEAACAAFDGDPSVKNVDRIMRLPHTLNIPTKPKIKKHPGRQARMAEVLDASGPVHTPENLRSAFPAKVADRVKKSEQPLVELDQPSHIERAKHYLIHNAPEAIEGAGGDETTYRVAARCRDLGVSEGQALELMLEHWNEQKASPPWMPDELERKVANAFTYATGGWGSATAGAEFEVLDIDVRKPSEQSATEDESSAPDIDDDDRNQESGGEAMKWTIETVADLRQLPAPKWIVEDWIPDTSTGIIFGKPGSGKTFVAFDLALHLAYGFETWHGAKLPGEPLKVLVIAREGHQGFTSRIDAFRQHHGLEHDTLNIRFMRLPIAFLDDEPFASFLQEVSRSPERYSLVIVDTVARVLAGKELGTAENITAFMDRCDMLMRATGATTIGVHHQSKSGSIYGSVFFEANADFVYQVERKGAEHESLRSGTIFCAKMKDGEDYWKRQLTYKKVAWQGSEGPSSSLVLDHVLTQHRGRDITDDGLLGELVRIIGERQRSGLPLSQHARSRLSGRYVVAVVAGETGVAENRVKQVLQEAFDLSLIEEREDRKLKTKFLIELDDLAEAA